MKVVILGESGHDVSIAAKAIMVQFPKTDIIVVENVQQLQQTIEKHRLSFNEIKPLIIEAVPIHPFVEVKQPKPFVKIKKNKNFDPHKFKKR